MRRTLAGLAGLVAFGLSFLPAPRGPLLGLAAGLAAVALLEPEARRRAWSARALWLVVAAAAAAGGLVALSAGLPAGLAMAAAVMLRLLVLMLLAALLARHIDAEALQSAAARIGARRLGLVFGLALNALPHLGEAWRDSWISLAVRRGARRPRLVDLPRLVETLLAHTARIAEDAAAAASLRGHQAVLSPLRDVPSGPLLVVVTGVIGAGKTSAALACVERLRRDEVAVAGFVQIPTFTGSDRTGFDIRDVATGEQRAFARKVGGRHDGQHGTAFVFEEAGFALAARALRGAPRGAVLVADEIGPVELRGAGHMPALVRAMRAARPSACLLTVRRSLIAPLLARLPASTAIVIDVEREADAVAAVLTALEAVVGTRSAA